MKGDRSKEDFAYLQMSYLVGPHEGWVAVERNHIALAIVPELPQDQAEMAVTEFIDLVASAYYPGWPIRDKLLRRLEDAPVEARRQFAQSAGQLDMMILRCQASNGPIRHRGDEQEPRLLATGLLISFISTEIVYGSAG
jgi:hypothetical protein